MATLLNPAAISRATTHVADPATVFAAATVAVIATAALLAGWFPIGFSVAIVFLFAGPHNWLEARYFMTRMPARWGRLRGYFTLGIAGVVALAATMIAIPAIAAALGDGRETWLVLLAGWNSALVLWGVALPLLAVGGRPWRLAGVPLARRSAAWRRGLAAVLVTGGLVVAAFWVGFLVDYPLTRSLYFTVALVHVLAEVPFLLREA